MWKFSIFSILICFIRSIFEKFEFEDGIWKSNGTLNVKKKSHFEFSIDLSNYM